jgi:hypothetical protein
MERHICNVANTRHYKKKRIMTKKELKSKSKDLLNKASLSEEDKSFLYSLFKNHPHYRIKEGKGIKDVYVKLTKFRTKCFYVKRKDDTETDISYIQCVDGDRTKKNKINLACRSAIRREITKFKKGVQYGVDKCPIHDEILTKENIHIDHFELTFKDLFNKWMKSKSVDDLFLKLNDTSKDGEVEIYFTDEMMNLDFLKFHNMNTNLRAVCEKANLSTLKKK